MKLMFWSLAGIWVSTASMWIFYLTRHHLAWSISLSVWLFFVGVWVVSLIRHSYRNNMNRFDAADWLVAVVILGLIGMVVVAALPHKKENPCVAYAPIKVGDTVSPECFQYLQSSVDAVSIYLK